MSTHAQDWLERNRQSNGQFGTSYRPEVTAELMAATSSLRGHLTERLRAIGELSLEAREALDGALRVHERRVEEILARFEVNPAPAIRAGYVPISSDEGTGVVIPPKMNDETISSVISWRSRDTGRVSKSYAAERMKLSARRVLKHIEENPSTYYSREAATYYDRLANSLDAAETNGNEVVHEQLALTLSELVR